LIVKGFLLCNQKAGRDFIDIDIHGLFNFMRIFLSALQQGKKPEEEVHAVVVDSYPCDEALFVGDNLHFPPELKNAVIEKDWPLQDKT
jgi:hypothetical protein